MFYNFLGVTILGILIIILINWYSKDGILCLFSFSRLGVLMWMLSLGLYDLQLSKLYNPTIWLNIICGIVILNFLFYSMKYKNDIKKMRESFQLIKKPNRIYMLCLIFTFLLCIFAFYSNYKSGFLRGFLEYKGVADSISYSYFFMAGAPVAVAFYVLLRSEKIRYKKSIYLLLCVTSVFIVASNLSRGPLFLICFGVVYYETYRYTSKIGNLKLKNKQLLCLILGGIAFIFIFGYLGDARTSVLFGESAAQHYKMSEKMPSGLVWIYIYITSPLENVRYILQDVKLEGFCWLNNLFYPVVKFLANLVGLGENYRTFANNLPHTVPYLWPKYGLNVGTFILDAYEDLGYIGFLVYLMFYNLIARLSHSIVASSKLDGLTKILMIPFLFQLSIWSIFENSIFGVTAVWTDLFFIYIWYKSTKIRFVWN